MQMLGSIVVVSQTWQWVHRLGGPGLILIGLVDNSVIPIPGGMDVFLIVLSAHRRELWFYYAIMATLGALFGGYVTYRLAKRGGKEALEKKFGKRRLEKVYKGFEKRGFSTVAIGALLPPPFPIVPVLMTAGALKYPTRKFLAALGVGRAIRFFALAFLSRLYGTAIIGWVSRYYKPLLYALIGLAVLGGIAALFYFKRYRPQQQRKQRARGEKVEDFPIPGQKHKARARK
jgi:membrane protein DedA with SNARE-associated domain